MDLCRNNWHVSLHRISRSSTYNEENTSSNYFVLLSQLPTLLSDGAMELKLFLVVNSGFIFGVVFMFLLAIFEDYITEITTKYLSYVTS